jgi:type I restriction enzyme, S subunit
MAVKPGYKQTEVGVIPQDWKDSRLGDCGEVIMGQSPPGSSYNRKGVGSPLINGPTEFTDRYPIKIQWTTQPARFCKTGDLLICVRGSSTGRTNYANGTYAIGRGVAAIRAKDNNDTEYLSYQVISGVSDILAAATGSTFPSVDGASFRKIVVPLPSPAEQRAIAGALSDVDALIGALDTALAKKRDLKQAAMQQLLTGQKRLPGFHGEWEVKRLGDLIEIRKGELITEKDAIPGNIPVIAGGKKPSYFHNRANRMGKTITISGSGASAGYVSFFETPIFASDCSTISEGTSYAIHFIYFFLHLRQEEIYRAQTGGAQPHIHPNDLRPLSIRVPQVAEQTAIAEVLSDMDAELAALEHRRDKTRALKQGMMQELLTGRVRLTKLKIGNG